MVNMRFRSDAQRRAMFANMFSGSSRPDMIVKNRFSIEQTDFKEGLNGVFCSKCGDIVSEDSIGTHSCSDIVVSSTVGSSYNASASPVSTIIEEHIIDDDFVEEDEEFESDEDNLFG